VAVGLFLFIQVNPSAIDYLRLPKEPTSFNLYTDKNFGYSFNYPTGWVQVVKGSDPEWDQYIQDNMVVFHDVTNNGVLGLEIVDMPDYNNATFDKATLSEICDLFIKNNTQFSLIDEKEITIDPLATGGQRSAIELRFHDNPDNQLLIINTFTYAGKYVYRLFFVSTINNSDKLMPAYDQYKESIRFR
jgi:hypothetical protein